MIAPATPANERERVAALHAAAVLDTEPEEDFDGVARLAAAICETPVARVSLVDSDRQFFKSCVDGGAGGGTPRDISFCGHAILGDDLFIVEDALTDERFADNPLVLGDDQVRFYAGAPLTTREGYALGALCVVDHEPRKLSEEQQNALRTLGKQVVSQLELRQRVNSLKQSDVRFQTLTDSAPLGIFETDADGTCTFINNYLCSLLGIPEEVALGQNWIQAIHPEDRQEVFSGWMTSAVSDEDFSGDYRLVTADGSSVWVQGNAVCIRDGYEEVAGFLATCLDITSRKTEEVEREEQLTKVESLAHTDPLTGLPNRRWWDGELRTAIARTAGERSKLCVAIIDVDKFKSYNDEHGHPEGDRLLRTAAAAWQKTLRGGDTIARYGGEEFAVILPGCDERDALPIVERLRQATPMDQTVSAGIATWEPWESPKALVERADAALYEAKRGGRNRSILAGEAAGINVSLNPTMNGDHEADAVVTKGNVQANGNGNGAKPEASVPSLWAAGS
jgi:diguanylate cyclase (GGDEF)-like protein/PAS domain S-box-containing protein